jgi:Rad3-related DNA helicase
MTTREALHALIDRLPDEAVEDWFNEIQSRVQPLPKSDEEWLEGARQLRKELHEKYGEITDAVTILEEIREERLNDIMGRR